MNFPRSQECKPPPDQQMSLADLATVAAMVEPLHASAPCLGNEGVETVMQEMPARPFSQQQQQQQHQQQQEHQQQHRICLGGDRHVQFYEARVVGTVMPCSQMSKDEREAIWYNNSTLDKFKCQVRSMCRKLRECPKAAPQQQQQQQSDTPRQTTTSDSSSRGLEHRVCRKRLRNKQLALRCVLKAQMRSSCPDFIANVSSKCTFWAKEIARDEGSRDFVAAYAQEDELNASVASMDISTSGDSTTTASTFTTKKSKKKCPIMSRLCPAKRECSDRCDDSESSARQVRRKPCSFSSTFGGGSCKTGILKSVCKKSKTKNGP